MTVKTKIKPMTFEKVIKIMKPFVAAKGSGREVLKMINFDGEWLIATDSHIMVRIHKDQVIDLPSQEPFLWDVYNNTICNKSLNYPQVSRMFPDYFECEASYNTKDLLQHVKELKKVAESRNKPIKMNIQMKNTILTAYNAEDQKEIEIRQIENNIKGKELNICFHGGNLQNVINIYKNLSGNKEIAFKFTGTLSPMRIEEETFDILVSPIRLY